MAQAQGSRDGQPRRRRSRRQRRSGPARWMVALLIAALAIGYAYSGAPGAAPALRQIADWLPADAPIRTAERTPRIPVVTTPRPTPVVRPDRDPPRNVVRVIPLKAPPQGVAQRRNDAPARNGEGAVPDKAPDRTIVGAIPRPVARIVPLCGGGKPLTCVVDGDTFWLDGEKIRIAGIDAPEVKGKCRSEKTRAAEATRRLRDILSGAAITLERTGKDKYGRTLAHVRIGASEAGRMLVDEGLARAWTGKKEGWC